MKKDRQPKQLKRFFWLLQYQFLWRFLVLGVSLLPFAYVLVQNDWNIWFRTLSVVLSLLLIPWILALETAMLLRIFPKPDSGSYALFSKNYRRWLKRNIFAEFVSAPSWMNNLVHRVPPLKILYYGILGYASPASLILAPDVKILDPDRCSFGKNVFIGVGSIIGGHTVKSLKLLLDETRIGDGVNMGSYCKLAVGVEIGTDTFIDYGVEIGMKCKIGKNVTIFAGVKIDDQCTVEDGSVIGKATLVGRKSHIGKGSYIGAYSRLGSRSTLPENSKLAEMTDLKN